MDRRPTRRYLVPAAAFVCLTLAPTANRGEPASPPPPGTPETSGTVVATIHAVDAGNRTVELISGTGLALRLVRLEVDAACEINVSGTRAQIVDLEAGRVVRVAYRGSRDTRLAVVIETVQPEAEATKR